MPSDSKRTSILGELKRPLLQPSGPVSQRLEEQLLGTQETGREVGQPVPNRAEPARVATVPVTFHLPVELRDKIKLTAQAKKKTMIEIAIEALQTYLDKDPVSEADLRRLLGL
jgi:hypothetical protein